MDARGIALASCIDKQMAEIAVESLDIAVEDQRNCSFLEQMA